MVRDDKWFTVFTQTQNSDNLQEKYTNMINLVFKELWKQDSNLEVMPIDQYSNKPHLISPDDLQEDFEFISDYFSPSNPGSMNLERPRDEDGKKKNRPNLHASIYVLSKKPLHLHQKTGKVQ